MGFSKERGDTISVANAPFTVVEKADSEIPLWKDPETISLAKDLFKYVAIAAIIAYLLLGVVRPLLQVMFTEKPKEEEEEEGASPPAGSTIDIVAGDEEEDARKTQASSLEKQIEAARAIAQTDPKAVANIIKEWTGANAS